MAAPDIEGFWTLAAAIAAASVTWIATTIGHLFQSRALMASLVDARIRLLIENYDGHIEALEEKIVSLERKIEAMEKNCHGCMNFPGRQPELIGI